MRRLNDEEKAFICDNWRKYNDKKLADLLGRSVSGIRHYRTANDLIRKSGRPRTRINKPVNSKAWKLPEHNFVRDNYRTMTDKELAAIFTNRSHKGIRAYRAKLGFTGNKQISYKESLQRNKKLCQA